MMSNKIEVSRELLERCILANDEAQPSKLYADLREALHSESFKKPDPAAIVKVWTVDTWYPNPGTHKSVEMLKDLADGQMLYAAPPEQYMLINALQMLIDYADDSDGCQYGTLSTKLVRDIAQEAIDLYTK